MELLWKKLLASNLIYKKNLCVYVLKIQYLIYSY